MLKLNKENRRKEAFDYVEQVKIQKEYNETEELAECVEFITREHIKKLNAVQQGRMDKSEVVFEVEKQLRRKNLTREQIEALKVKVEKFIWGYHILEELINDDSISDIKIISKDNIRIKRYGKREGANIKFASDKELENFINVVAVKNKVNLASINAIQTFTDKESNEKNILRFNISTNYVNSVDNSYLHIRKIPKTKYTQEELINRGMGTSELFEYLESKIKDGECVIFTGKGASGKTTIMNYLLDKIPLDNSALVIQENEELFSLIHPDMMFQRVRHSKGEGKIGYSLKDLSINGLLVDLDYFVIGEIKGDEAMYFLNACYTGHKAMCSVHGNNSQQAIDKLIDYMKYGSDYSKEDLSKMLSSIKATVVFMKNFGIDEISELKGYDENNKCFVYELIHKSC